MKELDLEKVSESHLSTAYVQPVMQTHFAVEAHATLARNILELVCISSNNKMLDSTLDRPDYAIDVYEQYQFDHPSSFEEIKCQCTTDMLCMHDFYRLALFAKLAIDEFKFPSMICFQSVGHKVTFFHVQHLDSMLCYLELCRIHLPFVTRDMKTSPPAWMTYFPSPPSMV
ncbi:hypothetical protein BCR43DRAFT_538980 [Syncephalastrum racemosum]|uniref:Uncharacterized protein n=1 Tax=Syncephalastrum racemosum TaxID=13706 RepID=A0A1X2H029_SYNRA|nr:hypothetical protein BCR43DRAFT_538980 [Syncephalastrum racemosum]